MNRNAELDNFVSRLDALKREKLERNLNYTDMKQSEIDWEQRRYEIAKEMLHAVFTAYNSEGEEYFTIPQAATDAVRYADALIKELQKQEDH